MRFAILGAALLFSISAAQLNATSYYVDYQSGDDSNSGLNENSAWQHCPGDLAAMAGPAACALRPGDTIFFKGGVTYRLTAATGIALNWDGSPTEPITYDGNSANNWGGGRARFTSNHADNVFTAFGAGDARHDLVFLSLEISAIGGAAALPADLGSAVPPRYGAGISFNRGATNVLVNDCTFSELGYWFNQRPMGATSFAGAGIAGQLACRNLTISRCSFSRMANGCDLSHAAELTRIEISHCVFRDSIVWAVDLPARTRGVATSEVAIRGCTESNNGQFDLGAWAGYGNGPRVAISTVPAGGVVSFCASATASPAASFQWFKNGTELRGATSATLRLADVTPLDAGAYTAVATNSAGSAVSNVAILAVTPRVSAPGSATTALSAPLFTAQPASQIANAFTTVSFSAAATGNPAPTYQWQKNGAPVMGGTNATLTLAGVTSSDNGTYNLVASNLAGSATSGSATLTVLEPPPNAVAPTFTLQPVSQTAAAFTTVTLTALASGTPAPSYQWLKNSAPIPGGTNSSLVLSDVSTKNNGTYTAVATNSAGAATSSSASLLVSDTTSTSPGNPLALGALSTQMTIGTAPACLPFTIDAGMTKQMLIRVLGPSLAALGLAGALDDPRLELYREGLRIGENDDWGGASALRDAFSRAGALPLADPNSKDSALLMWLPSGNYTVHVSGARGSTGRALVEVFAVP